MFHNKNAYIAFEPCVTPKTIRTISPLLFFFFSSVLQTVPFEPYPLFCSSFSPLFYRLFLQNHIPSSVLLFLLCSTDCSFKTISFSLFYRLFLQNWLATEALVIIRNPGVRNTLGRYTAPWQVWHENARFRIFEKINIMIFVFTKKIQKNEKKIYKTFQKISRKHFRSTPTPYRWDLSQGNLIRKMYPKPGTCI